jgi:hypothetical protein
LCLYQVAKNLGCRHPGLIRTSAFVELSAHSCGTGPCGAARFYVAWGVANHPRSGEVEIEVAGGLEEHPRGRLPAVADASVTGHTAVWVVWAGVDGVESDPLADQERAEALMHRLQSGGVEQAPGDPALVGDDDEDPARML